jgi:hypothetical protein
MGKDALPLQEEPLLADPNRRLFETLRWLQWLNLVA